MVNTIPSIHNKPCNTSPNFPDSISAIKRNRRQHKFEYSKLTSPIIIKEAMFQHTITIISNLNCFIKFPISNIFLAHKPYFHGCSHNIVRHGYLFVWYVQNHNYKTE